MLLEKGNIPLKDWLLDKQWLKFKKLGKKKTLTSSWEGPYQFVEHSDGNRNLDFEEGNKVYIIRNVDGYKWERSRRDLQIYHVLHD